MAAIPPDGRVLILAPAGRDAMVAERILKEAGVVGRPCNDLPELLAELDLGAGALVVTEEVFLGGDTRALTDWLGAQPSWSDFPVVLLTRQDGGPERSRRALRLMELLGNVTFLERPFHPSTLVAVVQMALRGRLRQYEARALLVELEAARATAEAARRAAELATESKSRFLAAASHDLRQPLQSLLLLIGVLTAGSLGERERRTVEHIERALAALKMLLDALLDVSKLDAGIITTDLRNVRISDLLTDIEAEYRGRAQRQNLELRVAPCSLAVRSDPTLLGRIVRNLLENALRYTERGKILVGCRRRGGNLLIQVTDTGVGIAADRQRDIFEEFVQVGNRARDREQGLGLGLAIVRRLSELLAHPVTIRSEPGHGSTFTVEVPIAQAPDVAAPTPPPPVADEGERSRLVLVIDDDPIVLMGLVATLEDWGARTLSASSCGEAMERVRDSAATPDLILADYRLRSGETGFTAVEGVRLAAGRQIAAILLTGDTAPEILREAHGRGLRLLHKPVKPADLRRAFDDSWR